MYRKDDPKNCFLQAPESTAFRKYYYSQQTATGDIDHNTLEDLFSDVEAIWPEIVSRLQTKQSIDEYLEEFFQFICLQRVRVPATRDAVELALANNVMSVARQLQADGKLPKPPKGMENILDMCEVSIDPHKSIQAMVPMVKEIGSLLGKLNYRIFHNTSRVSFITSDNPVIWFDPSVDERPYAVKPGGPIVFIFPVTPKLLIYGYTRKSKPFLPNGIEHIDLTKTSIVKSLNRQVCKYSYETVFAQQTGHERLIEKYAGISPVVPTNDKNEDTEINSLSSFVFGQRTKKPKWKG